MFSQHSVLSPPLLAAIDSQHTFGSYDATGTSNLPQRASVDASSTSPDDFTTSSHPRGTRLRASSATSFPNSASSSSSATSNSVNQNGHVNSNKKSRRSQQSHSAHSRSGSRPGPLPISGRVPTTHVCSSSSAPYDQRTLTSSLRNRSTPHLDGLQNGTARQEHSRASGAVSAMTAPSSPLASASASLALAMSPIAQASAMWDHLMPTDWTLDSSAPASPHSSLSRIPSDYFDPAILAQLRSQSGSSHPELRSSDRRPDPSPPVDMVFDRLSPHQSHANRSASQSEWAQRAAQIQQTAHLLGLHRLFASRSTPHLPDLDSSYIGHEFESPPPYAPRASVHETELERAAAVDTSTPGHRADGMDLSSNASSSSTLHGTSDPPLPPPISIPLNAVGQCISNPPSASALTRPALRARSSSRGSRSGPPSPSASFYGRRGLTSLSPFPAGLEMTPSIAPVSSFSSTPASPRFAPDSDGDEELNSMLSFSSTRSKQRRDDRRQTIASIDNFSRADALPGVLSSSLPGSSAQAQTASSRRRRSGSAGSARHLFRPRTPINPSVVRPSTDQQLPQAADEGSRMVSEYVNVSSRRLAVASNSDVARATAGPGSFSEHCSIHYDQNDNVHADIGSLPGRPTSDDNRVEGPPSLAATADHLESNNFATTANPPAIQAAKGNFETKSGATAAEEDEESFPLVLKLLLHSLRLLAAVPGCIGTFWLSRNAWILATRHGHLLSPGHMITTVDGTSHFWNANQSESQRWLQEAHRLGRRQAGSLDFAVACLWSMSTAYHALSFTTLLLRRWLLYYSILPSLIRLLALQAICWPLVRVTVHVFGADQPLGAWVVIGTTTALSDLVSRWVTSNIADAPLDDELDEEEEQEKADNVLGYLSDSRYVQSPPRRNASERMLYTDQYARSAAGQSLVGDSDWDARSGDESDVVAASFLASERERQRRQRRGGQGTRFWRAVIGGPSFAVASRRSKKNNRAGAGGAGGGRSGLSGAGTETEMEGESDWPGYTTDGTVLGGSGTPASSSAGGWCQQGLRRRLGANTSPTTRAGTSQRFTDRAAADRGMFGRRAVLPPFPFQASMYRHGHTRFVYRDGAWTRERTSSVRNFHWEVAVRRNVVPILVLSYLSMWILIFDAMRLGGGRGL